MASNLIVARGGVEYVPPISLAFWRWTVVVILLLPFTLSFLIKNSKIIKKENVNGKSIKTTTVHLQNANEIGGTCSTPPLATIKLDAIKIG